MIFIEGHADSFGAADYNRKLSEKRAMSLKRYLVGELCFALGPLSDPRIW